MSLRIYILALCLSLMGLSLNAQIVIDDTQTVEWNVLNKIAGPGVAISNIMFNSQPITDVNPQIGNFNSANANVGLDAGVILSNGNINSVIGPNDEEHFFLPTTNPAPTDPDLQALSSPEPAFDAAVLEFTFIPNGDTVEFDFVFASEEYPEFVGSGSNDVFGFFVAGPGITGPYTSPTLPPFNFPNGSINVALIPGTTTPVSIDNVNATNNSSYYISNGDGNTAPFNSDPQYIQADGFTTPIRVKFAVQCGEQYYIKFALGDVFDSSVDSYVFIEEDSFSTITPTEVFVSDGDATLLEGCDSVTLDFVRYDDISTPATVELTVSGTGTNGVDYTNIPSTLNFPIGSNTVSLTVHSLADVDSEGMETLNIHVENYGSTFCGVPIESDVNITILDNVVGVMSGGGTVCPGDSVSVQIDFTGNGPWDIEYTHNSVLISETISTNPYIFYSSTQEEYILTEVSTGGCAGSASGSATINAPVVPTLDVSGDADFCFGECRDVTFQMTGTPPFTIKYSIDNVIQPDLVTSDFNKTINLCDDAEVLPVSIFDNASGCSGTISGSATLNEHELPTLSVPDTVGICSGNDAEVILNIANGSPWTIEYNFNGSPQPDITGASNNDILLFSDPGNYNFTQITSETSPFCASTINETTVVDYFTAPQASIQDVDTVLCIGATIDMPVTFNGQAPFTFEYEHDGSVFGPFTTSNDTTITISTSGTYAVTSVSDMLCLGSTSGEYNISFANPIFTPLIDPINACNGQAVTLVSNPSGGIDEDYEYVWQIGSTILSTSSTATVIPSLSDPNNSETFVYTLTISQNTCGTNYVFPYSVVLNAIPNTLFTNMDTTLCAGESLNIGLESNGAGNFTIDYSVDNVDQTAILTTLNNFEFASSLHGEYEIISIEDDFCMNDNISSSFVFSAYNLPTATIMDDDTTICLGSSINIPITFTGTAPFTFDYVLNGIITDTITTSDNPYYLTIDSEGTHSIGNMSDAHCSSVGSGNCIVDFYETITVTLDMETFSCAGDELQVEVASISGGDSSTYSFQWLEDSSVISNDPILVFNPTESGVLEVRVNDFCNIESTATGNIIVEDYPIVMFSCDNPEVCPNELVDFDNNSIVNTTNNQFAWDFGDDKEAITQEVIHGYANPGLYDVSLTITTPNGCSSTELIEEMILVNVAPNADFTSTPEIGNMSEPEIEFFNESTGDVVYFEWNFGDGFVSYDENPIHTYPEDRAADYLSCLTVENIHGCSNDLCKVIEIQPIYNMYLPGAFTPDGDGLNELYGPVFHTSEIESFEFTIYDRDGHVVFLSTDPDRKWNGSYLTSQSYYVNYGIYNWSMRVKLKNHSDVKVHRGSVTVVR